MEFRPNQETDANQTFDRIWVYVNVIIKLPGNGLCESEYEEGITFPRKWPLIEARLF